MDINIDRETVVVFDLDDTLYKELDFLKSAYRQISHILEKQIGHEVFEELFCWYLQGKSSLDLLKSYYQFDETIADLVETYRFHKPAISLSPGVRHSLDLLLARNVSLAIVTDGRSKTQRNKLSALEVETDISYTVVSEEIGSEKPALRNFELVESHFKADSYLYVADNTAKDFVTPNALGWSTICLLDDGQNIHKQDFDLPAAYLPNASIENFSEFAQLIIQE